MQIKGTVRKSCIVLDMGKIKKKTKTYKQTEKTLLIIPELGMLRQEDAGQLESVWSTSPILACPT